jgi:xanthine dehydrogenase accessory factor
MIGSRRKVLSVYQALEKEGYSPEEFSRVFAPMGLEIGALSPEEIAMSITAELIAVRRNAHRLKRLVDEISARPAAQRAVALQGDGSGGCTARLQCLRH